MPVRLKDFDDLVLFLAAEGSSIRVTRHDVATKKEWPELFEPSKVEDIGKKRTYCTFSNRLSIFLDPKRFRFFNDETFTYDLGGAGKFAVTIDFVCWQAPQPRMRPVARVVKRSGDRRQPHTGVRS